MPSADKRVLLETTIQVDRCKMAMRRDRIDEMLKQFNIKVSTEFTLLEFKAVLIQECITIYNDLRQTKAYTSSRDRLVESTHPQHRLRSAIFNNIINVFAPSSFDVNPELNRELAEKACALLDVHIPRFYRWFKNSVDGLLTPIGCDRAQEAPTKKQVAYAANLPICKSGKNKTCCVEAFIQSRSSTVIQKIAAAPTDSEQLERAIEFIESVNSGAVTDISHKQCRRVGDFLISMEGQGGVTHAMSTNARDWKPLSEANGYEYVPVSYS